MPVKRKGIAPSSDKMILRCLFFPVGSAQAEAPARPIDFPVYVNSHLFHTDFLHVSLRFTDSDFQEFPFLCAPFL